jgi:hypothetical protein
MPRPTTLPEPWRSLAEKAGGVWALAEKFGVAESTIRRWAGGMKMSGPAQKIYQTLLDDKPPHN